MKPSRIGAFDATMAERLESGIRALPVEWRHAAAVASLPFHHRDPVDRVMIAQAIVEEVPIVTADPGFRRYRVPILW